MSQAGDDDGLLTADLRDLPPGLHLKALLVSAGLVAVLALLAMRYFL